MKDVVVFSIDNSTDITTFKKFLHYVDNLRAMQKLEGNIIQTIGMYEGVLEFSFLMSKEDFDKHIRDTDWVVNQDNVFVVSQGEKEVQYGSLHYKNGVVEHIGRVYSCYSKEAFNEPNWTYRPDKNMYWITL